jgi:hypothetical protein
MTNTVFAAKHHNQNPRIEERFLRAVAIRALAPGFRDRYLQTPIVLRAIHVEPDSKGALTLHSIGHQKDSMLRRTTREVTSPVTRAIDYP